MKKGLLLLVLGCCLLFPFLGKGQIITNFAGGGSSLGDGGLATIAAVPQPAGGVFDKYGNYYFWQSLGSPRVRMIDTNGIIHTVAGNGTTGFSGDGEPATAAMLNPQAITIDTAGNIYIADFYNYRIRKVSALTHIITTIGGTGISGYTGNGGPATAARMGPGGICVDRIGNVYFVDSGGGRIRKIDTSGIVTCIAGTSSYGFSGDGGPATAAAISLNGNISMDTFENLYLSAQYRVRKINHNTGIITTIAGNGNWYYTGDGMRADSAQFDPDAVAVDKFGNVYIADESNDRVYQVDTTRIFHLIAGNGSSAYTGDGGSATAAALYNPEGVTTDACSNVYIADDQNSRIRKVWLSGVAATSTATVTISASHNTVCAGGVTNYTASVSGGGTINTYYWYVNNSLVQAGSGNILTDTLAASDSVYCLLDSHNACAMPATARSNTIHSVVLPSVTPSITITPNPNDTVCSVNSVSFTTTIANGGTAPAYQWYVNGAAVSSGSGYSYSPLNGDSVRCILTSNALCASPVSTGSNVTHMVVVPFVHPTIGLSGPTITAPGNPVTISATITGVSGGYMLHWLNHGAIFATTTGASVTYTKAVGTDTVTVRVISNDGCVDSSMGIGHVVYDHNVSVGSLLSAVGGILFYPNPVGDMLFIENVPLGASYRLLNIVGAIQLYGNLQPGKNNIGTENLPPGIYILEVATEGGAIQRMKIVKE